jgi:hypothetical protein
MEGKDDEEDDLEEYFNITLGLSIWASYTFSLATDFPLPLW